MAGTTKTVTVHIDSASSWEDIVGDNIEEPRYSLCCGTILVVGGDMQSNTIDNDPKKNKIDKEAKTISFDWEVPQDGQIHLQADYVARSEHLPTAPSKNAIPIDPHDKEVYTITRDKKEPHGVEVGVGKGTNSWITKIEISKPFIGIENNFTVQPILWETVDGKGHAGTVNKYPGTDGKADYWVHGSGTITILPYNIINIWFQRESKLKAVSTVDQSEKGLIDVFNMAGPIEYDEDNGWPETEVEGLKEAEAPTPNAGAKASAPAGAE